MNFRSTFYRYAQILLAVFDCRRAWLQQVRRHNSTNAITMFVSHLSDKVSSAAREFAQPNKFIYAETTTVQDHGFEEDFVEGLPRCRERVGAGSRQEALKKATLHLRPVRKVKGPTDCIPDVATKHFYCDAEETPVPTSSTLKVNAEGDLHVTSLADERHNPWRSRRSRFVRIPRGRSQTHLVLEGHAKEYESDVNGARCRRSLNVMKYPCSTKSFRILVSSPLLVISNNSVSGWHVVLSVRKLFGLRGYMDYCLAQYSPDYKTSVFTDLCSAHSHMRVRCSLE